MTGRGIDQILPFPSRPEIHEPYMDSALDYVKLAEETTGPINRPAGFSWIWGEALTLLDQVHPDLRVINLETAVTTSEHWAAKGINYRMSPKNIACLTAAKINACALANNHILDWGNDGLFETLEVLTQARIKTAGAGGNLTEACAPAILSVPGKGRVLLYSLGSPTSGVPLEWAATETSPGLQLLENFGEKPVKTLHAQIRAAKKSGDIVIVSIHWGENWGYEISPEQRQFAHALIDEAGVDLIHGHSSHHPKGIEIYRKKLILYGCGDFINDYEGISGYEEYRDDLALMYFPQIEAGTGNLLSLEIIPMQIQHFSLQAASEKDTCWVFDILNREGKLLGTSVENGGRTLKLKHAA
jgi:poly-gamma-glutamate capsule biosynthesis protein CapA/YwtB (metallophosphatase superfamily)